MATVNYPENGTTPVDNAETTDDSDSENNGLTYTLTGTDAALFTIDADGNVEFIASPDFENPTDSDMDNVYDIIVNVEDSGNLTDSTPIAITVTEVNEAPDVTATTPISYQENGTGVVDNAETTDDNDSENNGLTYTLTGSDAALFTINADGELGFITPPDFENPMDAGADNVYDVTVNVEDAGGLTDMEDVVITITDMGEGNIRLSCVEPTTDKIILKNFGTEAQDISQYRLCAGADYTTSGIGLDMTVANGNLILQPGQTIELTGFAIDDIGSDVGIYLPTGAFSDPAAMVDFTQYGSAGNPREGVAVAKGIWTAGDFMTDLPEWCYTGDGTTENGVTFWDGNDIPVITSPNTVTVAENTPITDIVIDVASTDDNDMETSGLTYSFTGVGTNSPDEGDFNIDPMTGEITFLAVPDYENPIDDGTDNDYQVEVQVCDSGTPQQGCTTQIITITVTDVDEDGDGFTGTDDPDDADPCVPSNAASPCCEADAPVITKD